MLEAQLRLLKDRRTSWEPTWKDIGEQLAPYRVQLDPTGQLTRGDKRDSKTLNSRPQLALRVLAAGMMAGITSPARDWFRLTTSDPELNDAKAVRVYLDQCHERVSAALHTSNFYKSLSSGLYPDLCSVGTAAMFHEEVGMGRMRFRSLPVGEYWLDVAHDGKVDTCFREVVMTVRQLAQKFGLARLSRTAQIAYDTGKLDTALVVVHAVTPNEDFVADRIEPKSEAFEFYSCWWERNEERVGWFLEESGYHEFPVLCPRWSALTSDAYGRGPGWDVRGDCRALQHREKRKWEMVDKLVNPPMVARGEIKRMSLVPGDVTHIPRGDGASFEPAMTIDPRALEAIKEEIREIENRISEGMYAHLWNMLLQDERNQRPTATEIEAKRTEVALMLGPLLEGLNAELLEPVVERAYAVLLRNNMLPEPPDELRGQGIKIEFISIMHAMQATNGLVGIRTLMQEIANIAMVKPDALDKVNADIIVDELGRITGVRPDVILSQDEVDQVRQVRAQQHQAEQQGQAMLAATQGAKNLGTTDPTKLSDVASMLAPVAAAQGGALGPVRAA